MLAQVPDGARRAGFGGLGRLLGAASEPVVSISGVTITGGVASSGPESKPIFHKEGVAALGGGVEIPPQTFPAHGVPANGATVTISDSVITGNSVDRTRAVPDGPPCPDGHPCPVAWALGGGIDSWGLLTVVNTTVSDYLPPGRRPDAGGAGCGRVRRPGRARRTRAVPRAVSRATFWCPCAPSALP
jgi:hypothetical protein